MLLSPIMPAAPDSVELAMHIPDGFLSLVISLVFWSFGFLNIAPKDIKENEWAGK